MSKGDGPDVCGVITVVDLGIEGGEPSMWLAGEEDAPRPLRERRSHKWSAGSVLVVGGSTGMIGAAVFAGRSALHFGAGSVVVASPHPDLVAQIAPELLTRSLTGAQDQLDRFDVVVAGPGLDESDQADVLPLVSKAGQVLLDAGALTPEMVDAALEGGAGVVVTPHAGEFKRIAGSRWRGVRSACPGNQEGDHGSPQRESDDHLRRRPRRSWSGAVARSWPPSGPVMSSPG